MHKILIIDDEKDICFLISEILKDEEYITTSALNSDEAIKTFTENKPDLVILDVWLSNSKLDGIEILKEFKNIKNKIPVIIISGHGTVDLAVSAIKNGAYDFYVEALTMVLLGKYMKVNQFVKTTVLELVNLIMKEQYLALKIMAQV